MSKKKVLIVGASAKEYALAKYFSNNTNISDVYVAPGNSAVADFAHRVDIREDSVSELLEFAIKNDIDLTVASSKTAIKADIVSDFRANSQLIFAPDFDSAEFTLSRSIARKFAYKLKIPIAKFGIFEKSQLALDYVKSEKMPLLITTDCITENSIKSVCSNVSLATTVVNDIFSSGEEKVVIDEYIYGHPFTFYVITDGYHVLPLSVVGDYKFQEDGDGGLFTSGVGAYVPDYKISLDLVNDIMTNVVSRVLNSLTKKGSPYVGILGIEFVLKDMEHYVLVGFTPFLKEHDAQAVINSLDIDIYALMEACANGSFADDYDDIPIKNLSIVSCVLSARNQGCIISGLELVDDTTDIGYFNTEKNKYLETVTNKGRTLVITQTASTFTRAKELLYENIDGIYFDGMKYRRDICN